MSSSATRAGWPPRPCASATASGSPSWRATPRSSTAPASTRKHWPEGTPPAASPVTAPASPLTANCSPTRSAPTPPSTSRTPPVSARPASRPPEVLPGQRPAREGNDQARRGGAEQGEDHAAAQRQQQYRLPGQPRELPAHAQRAG